MLDRIRFWVRALFRPTALEREMHDEMQLHLDRRVDVLVAGGMSREDARLAARREFGNVGVHQEDGRDARRTRWIESIAADVRFAFRYFARKPLSSATIILVLAFGIGGHAFQVSMMIGLTTRPAPGVPRDVPLVRIRGMARPKDAPNWWGMRLSYPELREMAELRGTFASVTGWTKSNVVIDAAGALNDETARALFVTDDYFTVIGIHPTNGPGLPRATPEPQLVGVISHAFWEDVFDRGDVANRTIRVNGAAVRIVGVASPRFTGGEDSRRVLWMPLSARATIVGGRNAAGGSSVLALSSPDSTLFEAVGRLHPGVSPAQATAAVRVISQRAIARRTPPATPAATNPAMVYDADVVPLRGATEVGSNDNALIMTIWGIVTTLLLIVVCTNVSGLVVSASASRQQEIAVRLSLGASRARVIRQLVTESMLLALTGGALGLGLFWAITNVVSRHIPETAFLQPDVASIAVSMGVALGAGVLCGLMPAFHATRRGVAEVLKGNAMGATRRSRLQQGFVVAQVVCTQPLLVLIASLLGTMLMDDRPETSANVKDHVLRLSIDLQALPGTSAERDAALKRLAQKIGETPGVTQVLPDVEYLREGTLSVRAEDRASLARAGDPVLVEMRIVRSGYFAMMNVPLVRGTELAPADTAPTLIISSDLARELWGDADPIGRRFTPLSPSEQVKREMVVTGVYDARALYKGGSRARVYRPWNEYWVARFLIQTALPASDLVAPVRKVVREELPSTPIEGVRTLAQADADAAKEGTKVRQAVVASGILVLILASIGLYGVVALSVAQRRREIGVRMALGAEAGQVVRLFYRNGVKLAALGMALGLPISLLAGRILDSRTLQPTKSPSIVLVGGVILLVVLLVASIATLIPAARAATVNPVTALRAE